MWFYYIYVMCDKIRNAEEDLFEKTLQQNMKMTTKRNVTVTTVEWADLHMVDVKSTTENTMKRDFEKGKREIFSYGRRIQTWSFCALH